MPIGNAIFTGTIMKQLIIFVKGGTQYERKEK